MSSLFLRRSALIVLISITLVLAVSCSNVENSYVEKPVEELYNDAMDALANNSYVQAAQRFDEVERQHPYSSWATRAQMMAAYAHYKNRNYDESIIASDRFIKLHPGHRDVAYAYYLTAMCYYDQISDAQRDQKITQLALQQLNEIIIRFPNSSYAKDARLKLDLTRDHLAGKEMTVGRYYLKQHNYVAALNRFSQIIINFQTTSQVPEALHRLVEVYLALGISNEAQAAAAVLGHNFPGSTWYNDSYSLLEGENLKPSKDKNSWITQAIDVVF